MAAVREHGTPLIDQLGSLDCVTALGVDETAFQRVSGRRRTTFVTGALDVRSRQLLNSTLGRSGAVLEQWISGESPAQDLRLLDWRQWATSQVWNSVATIRSSWVPVAAAEHRQRTGVCP